MRIVGLFVKADEYVKKQAYNFKKWLSNETNITVHVYKDQFLSDLCMEIPNDLFCLFVLGGDGTFLSAVRWMNKNQKPIIGIKFGEVGFLSEITEMSMYSVAKFVLKGNFITQYRMRLMVEVVRNGKSILQESVLNDVVINKGALARLARIRTYIDGEFLTDYRADGLIIATPTGSTAYSLAAGGPIVHPSLNGIIVTPICPFTLTNRSLILPEEVIISIELTKDSSDLILTFDGQTGVKIDHRDVVKIKKSPYPVYMMTFSNQDYFNVLKTKLSWSGSGDK